MLSRSVKLSLRFMLPLAILLGLFAYIVVPLMDKLTLRWSVRDLDNRSQLLAATLQVPLREDVLLNDKAHIKKLFDGAIEDERLFALGFCDPSGKLLYKTYTYPQSLGCWENRPTAASKSRWCNCHAARCTWPTRRSRTMAPDWAG